MLKILEFNHHHFQDAEIHAVYKIYIYIWETGGGGGSGAGKIFKDQKFKKLKKYNLRA